MGYLEDGRRGSFSRACWHRLWSFLRQGRIKVKPLWREEVKQLQSPYDGRNLVPPPLPPIGDFESQSDIGTGLMPGFAAFDMARHEYTVIGSGDDIYGTTDAFHFLWRKISSDDISLSASVALVGSSGIPGQAGLMLREGLALDDAYAGVMIHGTGVIGLKFRPSGGVKSTEPKRSGPGHASSHARQAARENIFAFSCRSGSAIQACRNCGRQL